MIYRCYSDGERGRHEYKEFVVNLPSHATEEFEGNQASTKAVM
jgi:hypothetical protein